MLRLRDALADWSPSHNVAGMDPLAMLQAGWVEIVGAEVAQNSAPSRIAGATLTITTRSSAWSHQLSFLAAHVLRAVCARLPNAGIANLRFRVGRLTERSMRRLPKVYRQRLRARGEPPESADATEALSRFRSDVEVRRRERRAQGCVECRGCAALIAPGKADLCPACAAARKRDLEAATARLLFEAPWLGSGGTIALITGLSEEEYERIRTEVLMHWWRILARARSTKRLSRDGRERLIASSYVLLQSKLAPEQILPPTVRSILGEELHDLLYGEV